MNVREDHTVSVAAGAALRAERARRRLSQAELGARVGLHRMAISRLEKGIAWSLTKAVRLSEALGVPLDTFGGSRG